MTLLDEALPAGGTGQTLTLTGDDGRLWLIARYGVVRGDTHALCGTELRAALSQRAEGPLMIGTPELQWLVQAGGSVKIPCGAQQLVLHFLARAANGCAAYLVADAAVWR